MYRDRSLIAASSLSFSSGIASIGKPYAAYDIFDSVLCLQPTLWFACGSLCLISWVARKRPKEGGCDVTLKMAGWSWRVLTILAAFHVTSNIVGLFVTHFELSSLVLTFYYVGLAALGWTMSGPTRGDFNSAMDGTTSIQVLGGGSIGADK